MTALSETLFDYAEARAARDVGIALAANNAPDFMRDGLALIAQMPSGEFQGEDVRKYLSERGVVPKKHYAHGALILAAIKQELIFPTGRFEKTKSVKTHAHKTQVYRR